MAANLQPEERELFNRLTATKLALQILERKTELTDQQRWLVQTALEGIDGVTSAVLDSTVSGRLIGSAPL